MCLVICLFISQNREGTNASVGFAPSSRFCSDADEQIVYLRSVKPKLGFWGGGVFGSPQIFQQMRLWEVRRAEPSLSPALLSLSGSFFRGSVMTERSL